MLWFCWISNVLGYITVSGWKEVPVWPSETYSEAQVLHQVLYNLNLSRPARSPSVTSGDFGETQSWLNFDKTSSIIQCESPRLSASVCQREDSWYHIIVMSQSQCVSVCHCVLHSVSQCVTHTHWICVCVCVCENLSRCFFLCVCLFMCVSRCVSRVCVCHIYRDGHGMCVCTTVTVCVTVYYDVCQTPTTWHIHVCVTVCRRGCHTHTSVFSPWYLYLTIQYLQVTSCHSSISGGITHSGVVSEGSR